jgi:hypothetical protein
VFCSKSSKYCKLLHFPGWVWPSFWNFVDFFGSFCGCALRSATRYSSLAHAGGRGLESYTGEMIGTVAFVAAKVGEGVEVTPYIAVTLRAVVSGEVLSALLHFNSWLLGSGLGLGGELHAIRNAFMGLLRKREGQLVTPAVALETRRIASHLAAGAPEGSPFTPTSPHLHANGLSPSPSANERR